MRLPIKVVRSGKTLHGDERIFDNYCSEAFSGVVLNGGAFNGGALNASAQQQAVPVSATDINSTRPCKRIATRAAPRVMSQAIISKLWHDWVPEPTSCTNRYFDRTILRLS